MRDALHDYGGAIDAYQDALHDDPASWDASLSLARAYVRVALNTQALEVYQRCIRIKPGSQEAYEEIAEVYQRLGFLNKAILHYEKALDRAPQPESYLGMADCYVRQGEPAHAAEILRKAKSVLPHADYAVRLGEIYRKQGNLPRACGAWEEALKSDPHRGDVQLNLALAEEEMGRRSEADRRLKRLLAAYPASPLVHFLRAWILYGRGECLAARREAQSVQDLHPTEVVRRYNDRLLERLNKCS